MTTRHWIPSALIALAMTFASSAFAGEGTVVAEKSDLNPCAARTLNPCAAKTLNPCAAKTLNPCAAKTLNPCAAKTLNPCAARKLNPCGAAANPCGGAVNPCGGIAVNPCRFKRPGGVKLASGSKADLVAEGQTLWDDRTLGKSGLACGSCHIQKYGQMNPTFGTAYPHEVAMPRQQAGVSEVSAEEMVQFCMIVPLASDPLPWESRKLAALTAYVESIQPDYRPIAVNPCSIRNPCGAANPCNPCAARR